MCELLKERYEEAWGEQHEQEDRDASPAEEAGDADWAHSESTDQQGNAEERRMAALIVTGEPYTERKSTFQVNSLQILHQILHRIGSRSQLCVFAAVACRSIFVLFCGPNHTCNSLPCNIAYVLFWELLVTLFLSGVYVFSLRPFSFVHSLPGPPVAVSSAQEYMNLSVQIISFLLSLQAHVAPVASKADVAAVISVLMRNNKVARASHNMSAFRIRIPEKGTFLQDCDDDGEAAAGSRLLHLLQVRSRAAEICTDGFHLHFLYL